MSVAESPLPYDHTDNHWVGSWRDVVLVFAYEGSHDDVRHVSAGAELVDRLAKQRRGPVKLLFVTPRARSKPPDAKVRSALVNVSRRFERDQRVSKVAVVVAGEGFTAAVHRGAITGVLAFFRTKVPVKVHAAIDAALRDLLDGDPPPELLQFCEDRIAQRPDRVPA